MKYFDFMSESNIVVGALRDILRQDSYFVEASEKIKITHKKCEDFYSKSRAFFIDHDCIKKESRVLSKEPPEEIDLPFQTVWFEALQNKSLMSITTSVLGSSAIGISYLMVNEISPKKYDFICCLNDSFSLDALGRNLNGSKDKKSKLLLQFMYLSKELCYVDENHAMHTILMNVTESLLEDINHSNMGVYELDKSVNFKSRNGLSNHKHIKNIVICGLENKSDSIVKTILGVKNKIDWSHSWEVRGHWRKCTGIGKDRDGSYSVSGYTWIVNHVKGSGELVKKHRVFVGSNEEKNSSFNG